MNRKNVKLGFAVGGVALAVLVVYLLVGTDSTKNRQTATIAGENSNAGDGKEAKTDSVVTDVADTKPPTPDVAIKPVPTDASATDTKPATPTPSNTPSENAGSTAIATNTKPTDPNNDLWDATLNRGEMMMSETPTSVKKEPAVADRLKPATPRESVASSTANPPATQPLSMSAAAQPAEPALVPIPRGDSNDSTTATPAVSGSTDAMTSTVDMNSPASTTGRTHVVQKGETLAKISLVAYGSANYYPHILRANPGLNANKMKPGTTINLPAVSEVVTTAKAAAPTDTAVATKTMDAASTKTEATKTTAAPEAPIDPKSQYRVESGDSLYRISVKLYGNGTEVEKMYDLNKTTIGADKARLKLHMLLQLPEPPTVTASR